jgi:hypothetical protein
VQAKIARIRLADARLYEHTSQLLHSLDPAVHARSLADATFHPWFEQLGVLRTFFGLRPPVRCRRFAQWREAVAARPSVVATAQPRDFYLERYGALRDARHAQSA